MHNLGTVIRFEIIRTLKKPSFWVAAIALPILLVGYIVWSGRMGMDVSESLSGGNDTSELKLAMIDETKTIDLDVAEAEGISAYTEGKETGVADVKSGKLNVLYYIPADFAENPQVEVYTQTNSESLFDDYSAPMRKVLATSALAKVTPVEAIVLSNAYTFDTTAYKDGEESNVLGKMIIPMVALGIFYILICMFGNRLLMSTLEEKENRISEMILTSVGSKVLVIGKIISLILLGLLQVAILLVPVIVAYFAMSGAQIGGIDIKSMLPNIVFDPLTIIICILLLISSYVLFTGLCVTIGSLVPNAREASGYMTTVMLLVILPVFSINSFLSSSMDTTAYIMSYFPFSAPVALLLRNAFGNLPTLDAVIGIVEISVFAVIFIILAIRAFRVGTMEYSSKVSFKRLLSGK